MPFLQIVLIVFVAAIVMWFLFHVIGLLFSLAIPVLAIAGIIWLINRTKKNKKPTPPSSGMNEATFTKTNYNQSRKQARDVSTEDVKDSEN